MKIVRNDEITSVVEITQENDSIRIDAGNGYFSLSLILTDKEKKELISLLSPEIQLNGKDLVSAITNNNTSNTIDANSY